MTRKFKTLGLTLVAVLALSAMVASAASAAGQYTAASYPTSGTGHSPAGNDVFKTEGGTVECTATFAATLNAPTSKLTVVPTYTGCKAFGFAAATVEMDECDYTFETPAKTATSHLWTAPVAVDCPAGKEITVIAGNCEIRIPAQTPGGHAMIQAKTNTPASPDDVTVQATVTGITYTVVKDGFLCPFAGTGERHDGTYTQGVPVTFHSSNGKSITISG